MTGPTRPFQPLAKLLLTKQGAGKARRLRPKIAAADVRKAIALLRDWHPDANLVDREQSDAVCRKMLTVAVEPRLPHPDQDWDLVAVYAGLRGIERGDACVELGLAVKVNSPKLATLDGETAAARDMEPPPTHKPEPTKTKLKPPKAKPKPTKAKLKPKKAKPTKPWLTPLKKLGWGQLGLVLRLVSSHGKGRRRRLRKRPDPEDVRRVLRLVQERFPDVDFCDHLWWSGFSCRAFIATALSRHRPPWQLHPGQKSWDLVRLYMEIKGIEDRRAACAEMGLHEAVPRPAVESGEDQGIDDF